MEQIINVTATIGKFGFFDIGDGEYFGEIKSEKHKAQFDFVIFSEKIGEDYHTTYLPNPLHSNYKRIFLSDEWTKMFSVATTYITNTELIKTQITNLNDSPCIYNIATNKEQINVDDMMFYYLGIGSAKEILSADVEYHPLYNKMKLWIS